MISDSPDKSLLDQLIKASNIALYDLRDNRLGYLSKIQKSRLKLLILIYLGISWICFGIGIVSIYFCIKFANDVPLFACILWAIGLALFGLLWIKNALPMLKDLREGKVIEITGTVHKLHSIVTYYSSSRVKKPE